MATDERFQERIVRVERPARHYKMLQAPDGRYLGIDEGSELTTFDYVDDRAIWDAQPDGVYCQVASGLIVNSKPSANGLHLMVAGQSLKGDGKTYGEQPTGEAADFVVQHGPAELPSEYLRQFKENGWVCLPCLLDEATVNGLQKVSSTGAFEDQPFDPRKQILTEDSVVAKVTVEPITGWLIREYLQVDQIKMAHSPSLAVLPPDDGKRDVLAWHADFPYLWGITSRVAGDRVPVHDSGSFCMAIQRNVCITDFTRENGATCFKLGSHVECSAPPEEWGTGAAYSEKGYRETHGLPYTGSEAEAVEAPAGSIVIYDARTWHRTGVNRSKNKRGAMLQSVVPMYIMPFMDTSKPYKEFVSSPLNDELNAREKDELEALMVHKIVGPAGQFAIGIDRELTEMTNR